MLKEEEHEIASGKLLGIHSLIYGLLILLFLLLVLAAVWFMTVEIDEATNLLSVGQLLGGPLAGGIGPLDDPVTTSGGLYAAIHYPLMLVGAPIDGHRMVSVLFLGLTLVLAYRVVRAQGAEPWVGLFGVVLFMTVPGLLLQAGLALAEMMATFLVLAVAWYWTERGADTVSGSVLTGVVLGLACATRTSALVVLPAILVWGLLYTRRTSALTRRAAVVCAIAVVVFIFGEALYFRLFESAHLKSAITSVASFLVVTGLVFHYTWQDWLSHFMRSEQLFPTSILAVCSLAIALGFPTGPLAKLRPLCSLLILIGLIGWLSWVIRAPIPHVRYLYPALAALWLGGTLLITGWLMSFQGGRPRLLFQGAVVSVFLVQSAVSLRQVAYGEALQILYETVGVAPIKQYFRPFRARQEQAEFASLLNTLQPGRVCAWFDVWSSPFYLITNYKLRLYQLSDEKNFRGCDYLALIPEDRSIWVPTPSTAEWIRSNGRLQAQIGDYLLYKIVPGAPNIVLPLWMSAERPSLF